MKLNKNTLQKLEKMVQDGGYVLRYERGSFQSGYCILEHKKVIVLNKFLDTEGRINTLLELLPALNINIDILTLEHQKLMEEALALVRQNNETEQ